MPGVDSAAPSLSVWEDEPHPVPGVPQWRSGVLPGLCEVGVTKPRRGRTLTCKVCGSEFYRRPSSVAGARFCSYACQREGFKTGKPRKCETCGDMYYVPPSQVKHRGSRFCSDKCMAQAMSARQSGSKNHRYKGHRIKITRLDAYFSRFIRMRDGFTCQRCRRAFDASSQGLQNSHYIGRANKRVRFDEENCDALCMGCHQVFETHKGTIYREWKIERLGIERYQALVERSNIPLKVGSLEWIEVGKRVRARLIELNGRLV